MAKESEAGEIPPPYALSILICDLVYRDPATSKAFIMGCFTTIGSRSFPCIHPHMVVHVVLTDGRGKVAVKIRIVDADEFLEGPLYQQVLDVEFSSPLAVIEIQAVIGNLPIPAPGEYRVQVFADERFVIERRIVVVGPRPTQEEERTEPGDEK